MALNLRQLQTQVQAHLQLNAVLDEGDTLELLAHGEANVIFRLNADRLVRVAVSTPNQRFGGDASQVTAFERIILQYLKGSGIGHTLLDAVLHPSETFPYTCLITNYLDGEPLNYSHPHLKQCATTLARLHRLPLHADYAQIEQLTPPVQRVTQPLALFFAEARDYAQPYVRSPNADPAFVDMLHTLLAAAEARLPTERFLVEFPYTCLVHSDHTYENWVINDHTAWLIDWEWAELGSPAGDLGHFLSPVTVQRCSGYQMPAADRQLFLQTYYDALEDAELAQTMRLHFAAFGAFPAVRSLCWTAGYWVSAQRWYEQDDGASAQARRQRLYDSQQQFPHLWAEVMALLEEPLP